MRKSILTLDREKGNDVLLYNFFTGERNKYTKKQIQNLKSRTRVELITNKFEREVIEKGYYIPEVFSEKRYLKYKLNSSVFNSNSLIIDFVGKIENVEVKKLLLIANYLRNYQLTIKINLTEMKYINRIISLNDNFPLILIATGDKNKFLIKKYILLQILK
ncbi:hypothetical protein P7H50_11940 [Enterococcus durans]|uniref:hypothetical protein n=1 Tax=Enterococcus durans TaxID=53345 RepID=UPI00288FD956|nr:hypothetical protein [Enterococcus durans]MDT2837576.1 hypothetical protein [Enterococcus durans]